MSCSDITRNRLVILCLMVSFYVILGPAVLVADALSQDETSSEFTDTFIEEPNPETEPATENKKVVRQLPEYTVPSQPLNIDILLKASRLQEKDVHEFPTGLWVMSDDLLETEILVIKIEKKWDRLYGQVVKLLRQESDAVCKRCPGKRRNAPMLGLHILWGHTYDRANYEWSGGQLLDPITGDVRKCFVVLEVSGHRLQIHSYTGTRWLTSTQYWRRIDSMDDVEARLPSHY